MLSNLNRIVARRCNVLKGRNNTRNLASYLAAIDEGTSSTRFVISDKEGNIVTSVQKELTQHHPVAGHSEHDAMEIWDLTKSCMNEALIESGLKSSDIAAIGITNQRETTLVWNKHTGKPYHNAIVWNDNRTANICQKLMKGTDDINVYKQITGLPLAPYFSGTKLMYLLETVPGLREDAEKGDALFGTIDSWLVYKLTGGKVHVTDVTNASRTLLMDINTCSWSEHMMNELNIPSKMLPKIVASAMEVGSIASENEELQSGGVNAFQGVKIAGILGDQQSALFGQTCFDYKDIKVTYGTGAFLLMNTGRDIFSFYRSANCCVYTVNVTSWFLLSYR